MAGIGELAVFVTVNTGKALGKLSGFRKSLTKTSDFAKSTARSLAKIGAGAALAGVGALTAGMAALSATTKQAMSDIDDLAKTADKLGIGTEKLAGLRLAAEEGGLAVAEMDKSLQFMIRSVSEAAQGRGTGVNVLDRLGLNAEELNKLKPDEQFRKITEAMQGVTLESDRLAMSMDLFGRSGAGVWNVMKNGVGALDEAQLAAQELGLAVNRFDASRVEAANDALGRVKASFVGVGCVIAVEVAPWLTRISKAFTNWVRDAGGMQAKMQAFGGMMQKVAGFVLDMGEMIKLAFLGIQYAIVKVIAVAASGIDKVADQVVRLAKLTGVGQQIAANIKNGTSAVAGAFDQQASELGKKLNDAWLAPPPSAKLKAFTAKVASEVEQAREQFNQEAAGKENARQGMIALEGMKSLWDGAKSLGKAIGDGFSKTAEARVDPAQLTSAMAGTAEEYRLRASMMNAGIDARNTEQAQLDATTNNTTAVEQMTEGLSEVAAALNERAGSVLGFLGV